MSLVGIGSEKTSVKIVADPSTDKNTHHIEAAGKFGKMTFTIENVPDANNPKTSRLAILSAIETLKNTVQMIFRLVHNMAIIATIFDMCENYRRDPIL